jgi:hypothetical protein
VEAAGKAAKLSDWSLAMDRLALVVVPAFYIILVTMFFVTV